MTAPPMGAGARAEVEGDPGAAALPGRLDGRRVLVTRPCAPDDAVTLALREAGAEVVVSPVIAFGAPSDPVPLQAAAASLATYDWLVFTSVRAVEALAPALASAGRRQGRIAAVGPSTAARLQALGAGDVVVPSLHRAAELPGVMGELAGRRVLLPRSQLADEQLPEALRRRGALVTEVEAYRTLRVPITPQARAALREGCHAVILASPSAVASFLQGCRDQGVGAEAGRLPAVTWGPTTTAAAVAAGLQTVEGVDDPTPAGLVAAVARAVRGARVDPKRGEKG